MAIGSAVRTAQSLGLQLSGISTSSPLTRDAARRAQLWQLCMSMDRQSSWLLGRISTYSISLHLSPAVIQASTPEILPYFQFSTKMSELYDIAHHIMLAQISTGSSLADRLGLERLYQNQEYPSVAVKLDACLSKWELEVPQSLKLEALRFDVQIVQYRQAVMLRLRYVFSNDPILLGDSIFRSCSA